MIEIIREEECDKNTKRQKKLPKDIRQIGKPDSGDRIYVENQAYRFLRSRNQTSEKTAYVLLGRFEELNGKWCTFVESAICLTDMQFEGNLPLWTDHTWAYIFKHLNRQHDDMAIAGCAIDVRGALPEMNVRLEAIHQKNFGGPHQIMLLMDSLEKEEVFYANYNGRLYRKEGFYIYYDKNLPENLKLNMQKLSRELDEEKSEAAEFYQDDRQEESEKNSAPKKAVSKGKKKKSGRPKTQEAKQTVMNDFTSEDTEVFEEDQAVQKRQKIQQRQTASDEHRLQQEPNFSEDQHITQENKLSGRSPAAKEPDFIERAYRESEKEADTTDAWSIHDSDVRKRTGTQSGRYRERLRTKTKRPSIPSYVPSAALLAVACLLGFAVFHNQRKMNQIQTSADQGGINQAMAEQNPTEDGVKVETISGNVKPQDTAAAGADAQNPTGDTQNSEAATDGQTGDIQNINGEEAPGMAGDPQKMEGEAEQNPVDVAAALDNTAADGQNVPANTEGMQSGQAGVTDTDSSGVPAEQNPSDAQNTDSQAENTQSGAGNGKSAENASGSEKTEAGNTQQDDASEDAMAQSGVTEAQAYLAQGYYIVQKGDNLVGICRKIYQTTAMLDKLCEVNNIEDRDAIYAGQYLTLPN